MNKSARWIEYYANQQKTRALNLDMDVTIDYGEVLYESPIWKNTRWLVTVFENEYNVFVDRIFENGRVIRDFGATFNWKNRALDFALQMYLVCSGGIRRENRWIAYG